MSNAQGVMELRLLTSIERFKCFCVLKSSFLLLTQKKRSKRKRSLAGALGVSMTASNSSARLSLGGRRRLDEIS